MIIVKQVTNQRELTGIRQLQEDNLRKNIAAEEAESQGFVMAEYSIEFLQMMHNACASIVALDGDQVVGYALVAVNEIRNGHPLLADLFDSIDKTYYGNILLNKSNYVVVGQLCVMGLDSIYINLHI